MLSPELKKVLMENMGLAASTLAAGFGIWAIWHLGKWAFSRRAMRQRLDNRTIARILNRESLEKALAKKSNTKLNDEIVAMDFQTLLSGLKKGTVKAVDTLQAYQSQALKANEKLNCVVHFIDDAVNWAETLDQLSEQQRGPLHGMPISIKECYAVKNCDSTAGLCQFANQPCEADCLVVETLKSLGAVPFCMTNVPQAMFSLECSNPIYGASGNAHDPSRECGGSTGGEGALIAAKGSLLGIGSDIGGSLRNPAALNGIFSLKPTSGRHLSQKNVRSGLPYEQLGYSVVGGFMASSASALVTAYKSVYNVNIQCKADHTVIPMPWKDDIYQSKRKLKIGFYLSDGAFVPHPGCSRAVREAVDLLRKSGHTLVEFHGPPEQQVLDLFMGFLMTSQFVDFRQCMKKDVFIDHTLNALWLTAHILRLPDWMRRWIINPIAGLFTKDVLPKPITHGWDLMEATHQKNQLAQTYLDEWNELGLDLIISTASLLPATEKGVLGDIPTAVRPYIPWNLLDFPAGIVPITKVNQQDDLAVDNLPTNDIFYSAVRKHCKGALGLPLGVQIIGRRYQEELVLKLMDELEHLSGYQV